MLVESGLDAIYAVLVTALWDMYIEIGWYNIASIMQALAIFLTL